MIAPHLILGAPVGRSQIKRIVRSQIVLDAKCNANETARSFGRTGANVARDLRLDHSVAEHQVIDDQKCFHVRAGRSGFLRRQDLDAFVEAMKDIDREAQENPQLVIDAPHSTRIGRLDEAAAARKPVLRWKKDMETLSRSA